MVEKYAVKHGVKALLDTIVARGSYTEDDLRMLSNLYEQGKEETLVEIRKVLGVPSLDDVIT